MPLYDTNPVKRGSSSESLIASTTAFAQHYMSQECFDASHDFTHIERVSKLAQHLQSAHEKANPEIQLDSLLITLTVLLHDVSDHKYFPHSSGDSTGGDHVKHATAEGILLAVNAPPTLASLVQVLVSHVSCSHELTHPEAVAAVMREHPELGIVQDADRLDAIGAVGVGRAFTFGGAKERSLETTFGHFEDKLLIREGMMKTEEGKRMAKERCDRLRVFMGWWEAEIGLKDRQS
jgi:uncharacterized protein